MIADMRVIARFRFPLALATVMVVAGCSTSRRTELVSERNITMPARSADADRLWDAVCDTLREHRYRLDRVDRNTGVVTTLPVISAHVLEFWRKDVATRHDLWESTLNPIRRWAEVTVSAAGDETWAGVSIRVHKERLSSPDRQFNSTGAAYQYFGNQLPSTMGLARITEGHDQWLSIGRDGAMEDYLLGVIFERAGRD